MSYYSCKTTMLAILLTELAVAQPPEPVPPSYQAPVQSSVTSQGTTRFSWGTSPLTPNEPLRSPWEMLRWPFGNSSRPSSSGETSPSSTPPAIPSLFSGETSPAPNPQRTPPATPSPPPVQPPQVIRTSKRVFAIPFQVRSTSPADIPREVELLFSTNRGFSWQSYARLSPDNSYFVFQTDHEGEYWFRIRVIGQDGTAKNLTPHQPPTIVRVESETLSATLQPSMSPTTTPTLTSSSSSSVVANTSSATVSISDEPPTVSQSLLPPSRSTFRDADPQNVSFDDMFPVATELPPLEKVVSVHLAKPDISNTPDLIPTVGTSSLPILNFLPDLNTSPSTVPLSTDAAIRLLETDPLPFVDTIQLYMLRNDTTVKEPSATELAVTETKTTEMTTDTAELETIETETSETEMAETVTVPTDLCGKITLVSLEINVPRPYIVLEWETGGKVWNQAKVSVFRGETPAGPWTSIAEELDNTGKHSWYIQQEDRVPFHLCIELQTADGNVVGDMTTRPIQIP